MHAPLWVSVYPPHPGYENNGFFEGRRTDGSAHAPNTHWFDPFRATFRLAQSRGITLATADVLPASQADIVVFVTPPASPTAVPELKKKNPRLKTVLVLWETALGSRYQFNPRNHGHFDAILTNDERLVDNRRCFRLLPRAYDRSRIVTGLGFEDRRLGCLVGTRRRMRYRRTGLMAMKAGWHFSFLDWIDYVFCPGQLITYRHELGVQCASIGESAIDLFGEGWDADERTRAAFRGILRVPTLAHFGQYRFNFAIENHAARGSLITERIWDALYADSVPVYYGNPDVGRHVPKECFIDARGFPSIRAMLDWLRACPPEVWSRYRVAGREFLSSSRMEPYLPDSFARDFLRPIEVLKSRRSSAPSES